MGFIVMFVNKTMSDYVNILTGILGDDNGSSGDLLETVQPDLPEAEHLVNHQAVVEEQPGAAHSVEVGEQVAETTQPRHPVEQEVLGHLPQLGEAPGGEVRLVSALYQHDLDVALDHCAALELTQGADGVAHVDALADAAGRGEVQGEQKKEEHDCPEEVEGRSIITRRGEASSPLTPDLARVLAATHWMSSLSTQLKTNVLDTLRSVDSS